MTLKVPLKLHPDGKAPVYALQGDAGLDLFSREAFIIQPNERKIILTGVHCAIPFGYEMQIRMKSGLAAKHGLIVVNAPGTIDSNYRGEIGVILLNTGKDPISFEKHQKIAQAVFNKIEEIEWDHVDTLEESTRGSGGFGSTGK